MVSAVEFHPRKKEFSAQQKSNTTHGTIVECKSLGSTSDLMWGVVQIKSWTALSASCTFTSQFPLRKATATGSFGIWAGAVFRRFGSFGHARAWTFVRSLSVVR